VRFFLTTAIDYPNNRPHLGTAYEKVTADVIARYKRLRGYDTYFLMGNDEHSQNVFKRAMEQGLDPLAYCDQKEVEFRSVWQSLDVSFTDFIRTTERRHRLAVEKMAQTCYDRGDIYEGVYEGWYCVSCEAFKPEKDLVDGRCAFHPTLTLGWIKEKNYFFRLSSYRDRLLRHFEEHPGFLEPEPRRNEVLRLLESGLEDISMSRAGQAWGVPLPFSPESVVYVWFDALINYVAAVGYGSDDAQFKTWWPADLHIVGKDITRFHTVFWPAMLWSAGVDLPQQVFGHGWVNFDGQRMSKSLGTSVDPADVVARFGADPLRLYLTKEITYGNDGDFSWDRYEERYNVDLANNLGNLVSRLATMAERYRGSTLTPAAGGGRLPQVVDQARARYQAAMDALALHEGAAAAFAIVDATNGFIAETAPWLLARDPANSERLSAVLFDAAEAVRVAAVMLLPVMPSSAGEILRRMGERRPAGDLRFDADATWRHEGERQIVMGPALWPRAETAAATARVAEIGSRETRVDEHTPTSATAASAPAAPPAPAPVQPTAGPATAISAAEDGRIAIDDFMRVELRTAKVVEAEAVPKSKKLVKLLVDLGAERRTIVAGIAEAYQPADLVGRSIVIVANLKPAKLMGIESNGMILAASPDGGAPSLLAVDPSIPPGTRVR
jgi:methionyl-tRNA synthetase